VVGECGRKKKLVIIQEVEKKEQTSRRSHSRRVKLNKQFDAIVKCVVNK
jgi:hypothetical protein